MRRFFRILWTTFAGCSLLLCAAAAGVWVRSHFILDAAQGPGKSATNPADAAQGMMGTHYWDVETGLGRLGLVRFGGPPADGRTKRNPEWEHHCNQPRETDVADFLNRNGPLDVSLPGLRCARRPYAGGRIWMFDVHLAYPTALTALAPLAWSAGLVRRRRRTRRERVGLCKQCGYDLRASPGRCPECGDVPAR